MAVYRSDQAQLTFATEAAQGGDPEMMEGTLAFSPSGTPGPRLDGAHAAGSRTLTLLAEFYPAHNSSDAALLAYGDTITNAADASFSVDNGSDGDPEVDVGRVLQVSGAAITQLSAAITDAEALSFAVDSVASISDGDVIVIEAEYISVTSIASTTLTVVRGVHDTVKATHIDNTIVQSFENMKVTAVNESDDKILTVTRGFEGTTASSDILDNQPIKARFIPGDIIRIGTINGTAANTDVEMEVRRVEATNGTTIILDRPLAFYHPNQSAVRCISAIGGHAQRNDHNKYITFIPGIYESVDTPDPVMSIDGRRFLNTQSKRNYSIAYAGQQSLTGSISGIILLNGWPLRFPIGSVTTAPEDVATDTITVSGAHNKGDVFLATAGGDVGNLAVNDYIQIIETDGTKSEVRKIIADISDTFKLNAPLQFAHASGALIHEVASTNDYYEHVINQEVDLDTVSWHVHMRDSSETAANDFDRRYVGGMIGSSTISADEGGMVSMSWDSVSFLNMIHNQANQTTVSTNLYQGDSSAAIQQNMPRYGLMQLIDSDDVGTPGHATGTASDGTNTITNVNDGSGYPTTQPYYFSQGTIKYFDTEFARIRSFSLSISNGEEPRYYIGRQGERARGPYEIREGQRSYSMSTSVVLPDTIAATANTATGATELFKQLLLEGNYGSLAVPNMRGFSATIKFERGTNDYIIIDIPGSTTAGTPTATTNALNSQGLFINSASHGITGENPFQIDLDMIFNNLKITIRDDVPVYP